MKGFLSLVLFSIICFPGQGQSIDTNVRFSTNQTHLTIWNGEEYQAIFVKGVNLGAAVPGTYPGQLAASRQEYSHWLAEMKDAGFNTIRLYTLHFPRFYEVLDSFNLANPNSPILLLQGVWLSEWIDGYNNDLEMLTQKFETEIEENVDALHGNRSIPFRYGKSYGDFSTDASEWVLGWVIGREVYGQEVLKTISENPSNTSFSGTYFNLPQGNPGEVWVVDKLEHLVNYEFTHYQVHRPVSYSNWPTTDPLEHPEEPSYWEDAIAIDLNNIDDSNAPGGFFASYHVYPYYPDFISDDSGYQQSYDAYGANSYLGYMVDLRNHYNQVPLLIAEFGIPSSWGVAHYASNGMNHGGFTELEQGQANLRLLQTIDSVNCAGGVMFAWIDEWFKSCWITSKLDYEYSKRIKWHNITNPEQNYGLKAFSKDPAFVDWGSFPNTDPVTYLKAGSDFDYFHVKLGLESPLNLPDTLWLGIDTYSDSLGESILPSGDTVQFRAEFALRITNYSAELYVTQAYDLFEIWHDYAGPEQLYHSIPTDGEPWRIVRWRNDNEHEMVQYIGSLNSNTTLQLPSSHDAVTIDNEYISIKIPYTLLHFSDPTNRVVIHDSRATSEIEDLESDGVAITVFHNGVKTESAFRYLWPKWSNTNGHFERFKDSYYFLQLMMPTINSKAIPFVDEFITHPDSAMVSGQNVLDNDKDYDGGKVEAVLRQPPSNGNVFLNLDGTFAYYPNPGFTGSDQFTYSIFDGYSLSAEATVHLEVPVARNPFLIPFETPLQVRVFPNPSSGNITLAGSKPFEEVYVLDLNGKVVEVIQKQTDILNHDLNHLPAGNYLVQIRSGSEIKVESIQIVD